MVSYEGGHGFLAPRGELRRPYFTIGLEEKNLPGFLIVACLASCRVLSVGYCAKELASDPTIVW